jgi:ABC-type lipoprotein release transport system permease subunit
MTGAVLLKIAWRNLWRHPRRTLLTALAFAAGVFLLIVSLGLGDGMHEKLIETGVQLGSGHVVIEARDARDAAAHNATLSAENAHAVERVLLSARLSRYVAGIAPRLVVSGLLSSASNSTGVTVIGVEPERERGVSLLPARLSEGTFLAGVERTAPLVVGRALADKLRLSVGSKVVLMTQAGDEIDSLLLRVRGIFSTGMLDADAHLVAMRLEDLQALLDEPGALSQTAVFLHSAADAQRVRDLIAEALRQRPLSVLTWREAMPELDQFIVIDDAGNYLFNGIVLIMVTLGVLNTVLMAVLERHREFGLLLALGMKPRRIAAMVLAESLLLTALGTAIGLGLGWAAHRYFAVHGLDLAAMMDQTFSVAGVAVDTVVHSYLYPHRIPGTLLFVAALGFSAALYPAIKAARTDPTEATHGG